MATPQIGVEPSGVSLSTAPDSESASQNHVQIRDLWALPDPDYVTKQHQARCGVVTVLGLCAVFVGLTHAIALEVGNLPKVAWWICLVAIYAETLLALSMLCAIVYMDPGVIQRSPETCFPLPSKVEDRILGKEGSVPLEDNIYAFKKSEGVGFDEPRHSFCVRCLVWRDRSAHHCRICGRCVSKFDHHCDFLGRCIATNNLIYFRTMQVLPVVAFLTCSIFCIFSLARI